MAPEADGLARAARRLCVPAFALLALLVVGAHWRIRNSTVALGVEATGYREIVNRGLRERLEWSARDDPPPRPAGPRPREDEAVDRAAAGPLELDLELGDLSPAERRFALMSFLLDDLEYPQRFSRDAAGRARLRAGFRRRPLPFSESARWRGRLLFRRGAREVALRAHDGREVYLHLPRDAGAGLPRPESVPLAAPGAHDEVRSGPSFKWETSGQTAFSLHAVPGPDGAAVVVLERPRETAGTLVLSGTTLPRDEVQRTLEPGDWLVLRPGGRAPDQIFVLDQGVSGAISEFRRGREGFERTFAPAAGLEPLARSVAGVYDALLSQLVEANARNAKQRQRAAASGPAAAEIEKLKARDLRLTIDAALQAPAQKLLEAQIATPGDGWHVGTLPREPPRAALSVLDLATGELLAAASFPQAAALDRHLDGLRRHVGRGGHARCTRPLIDYLQLQHERRRERLLANHVFDAHQVGSTVKPLLAAGFALHWTPAAGGVDPLELTLDCHGGLGLDLPPGTPPPLVPETDVPMGVYDDPAHGRTGFRQFLARSCNTFMFRLAAQALHATRDFRPADCDGRLEHVLRGDSAGHPETPEKARGLAPFARFAWLGGAFLRDPETRGVGGRRHAWWSPASDEMFDAVERLGCSEFATQSLAAVSPALVNLDVTSLSRCHPNLSSLLKGGGTNRWSNADLSIAYARLASGRALEGRVVLPDAPAPRPAPSPGAPAAAFDARDCARSLACADPARFERVRAEVLGGMGEGFFPGGTSRGVQATAQDALARLERASGRRWGAYAKTGSSERPLELVTRVDPDELRPTRRGRTTVDVREANFTLLLIECAPDDDGARAGTLACSRLPPLGPGLRGYALHLWTDGVPGVKLGGDAARWLNGAAGRALFDRLARAVEAGS